MSQTILSAVASAQRRRLLKGLAGGSLGLAGVPALAGPAADPWRDAEAIAARARRQPPFRKEDFPITGFGAEPCAVLDATAWVSFVDQALVSTPAPGAKDCYPALTAAIQACHAAGGGRVLIPKGNWYVRGPMVLLSNVHVHLEAGAHIYFSNIPEDYARHGTFDCGARGKLSITRWEGNDCLNYSSMIYAYNQHNIALTGADWTSIIDGQAGLPFAGSEECWWSFKGRARPAYGPADVKFVPHFKDRTEVTPNPLNPTSLRSAAPHLSEAEARFIQGEGDAWRNDSNFLRALAEARVPVARRVFGIGHFLRPHMVQFISCTNVYLADYQLNHSPFWQHNPVDCHNVHVRHVYANSMGPNSDGFDPESCTDVLIEACEFNTGDDCIAIDSGKGNDTQYGPARNIVIQKCRMQSGHGAITLGSIMSGGIENVYAQDLVFENRNWKIDPLSIAIRLKTNLNRGGFLRNLYVRNVEIPNGIRYVPGYYKPLPGSAIAPRSVASSAGGVLTIDCDYDPGADTVRTRLPTVSGVHIEKVRVGNVPTEHGQVSSFQAIVILGPVQTDYNGPQPAPKALPVSNVTIRDCDFGTPVNAAQPIYLHNVSDVKLTNVKIGARTYNQTLAAP